MLRSAASRVLRSALVSIAAAACLVCAALSATLRLCCSTACAVRLTACSVGVVLACAVAMSDNADEGRWVRPRFVARLERSESRDLLTSYEAFPGLRFAQSGLRPGRRRSGRLRALAVQSHRIML